MQRITHLLDPPRPHARHNPRMMADRFGRIQDDAHRAVGGDDRISTGWSSVLRKTKSGPYQLTVASRPGGT